MGNAFADLDAAIEAATSPEARAGLVIELSARLARLGAGLVATATGSRAESDRNLDVEETAGRLGVSAEWVYRNQAKLPSVRLGRRLLFSERGLDRFLERRRA